MDSSSKKNNKSSTVSYNPKPRRRKSIREVCLQVTIVRHGETDMNAAKPRVLQGQSDTPLNTRGKKEAMALAHRLRKTEFDRIYCSDLLRCKETAKEVLQYQPVTPIVYEKKLRERDLGQITGIGWPDVKAKLKEEGIDFENYVPKCGGESGKQFEDRVVGFYSDIVNQYLIQPYDTNLMKIGSTLSLKPTATNQSRSLMNLNETNKQKEPIATSDFEDYHFPSISIMDMRKIKMEKQHILIITHGGWIETLNDHLLNELEFKLENNWQRGFPKNTGIYNFKLIRVMKENDYDWEGTYEVMNCVSHLAKLDSYSKPKSHSNHYNHHNNVNSKSNKPLSKMINGVLQPLLTSPKLKTSSSLGSLSSYIMSKMSPKPSPTPSPRNSSTNVSKWAKNQIHASN